MKIFKGLAMVAGAVAFVSACAVDSLNVIPTIAFIASVAYLSVYVYANRERLGNM